MLKRKTHAARPINEMSIRHMTFPGFFSISLGSRTSGRRRTSCRSGWVLFRIYISNSEVWLWSRLKEMFVRYLFSENDYRGQGALCEKRKGVMFTEVMSLATLCIYVKRADRVWHKTIATR